MTNDIGIKIGVEGAAQVQADLRQVAQATQGVASTMTTVGQALGNYTQMTRDARVEANLLRQANRQLAMQMTDVVTSLASGMPAWMVFIQQGGQIKDSYGGIGQAISGVTGYLRTLINPLTLAAAGFAGLGAAMVLGRRETNEYIRTLTLTGNAAGMTASQLDDVATAIGRAGGSQSRAAAVLTEMARQGGVGAENLQRFTAAAIDLERAGGPAAEKTAQAFAKLADAPLAAALELNKTQNFLTTSTYEQIKALEEQGKMTQAADLAQKTYAATIEQRAPQIVSQLGFIEQAWKGIKDAAALAGNVVLDVGRDSTQRQIQSVQARISIAERGSEGEQGLFGMLNQRWLASLKLQLEGLREVQRLENDSARASAERARQVEATAAVDKRASEARTGQQKMEIELAQAINELNTAQSPAATRVAVLTGIMEKYATTVKTAKAVVSDEAKATAEAVKTREKYVESLETSAKKIAQENQALADQIAQVTLGKEAYQRMIDVREEESAVILEIQAIRALERAGDQKEADALKAQAAAIRQRIALRQTLATVTAEAVDKEIMARRTGLADQDAADIADTKRLKSAQDIVAAIERETAALNMSNVEREVSVALLELERLGIEKGTYAYDEYAKKIRDAIVNRDTVRRSIQQTEEIARDWQRTADQIGQSLTDALMQGGKSAWEYIKGLFRSMVLRPIIQAVVNPVVGAVGSVLGLATGTAAASSGAAGAAGTGLAAGGLAAMFSGLTSSVSAGVQMALAGNASTAFGVAGSSIAAGSTASGVGLGVGAAMPYALAAVAVLNALGVFRSKSIVGGGLTGTLGMGDIQSYDLQRRGGTLFSGPDYSLVNRQTSAESAAIQGAFEALRANAASMAEALGLSSTAVKSFTTTLGTDIVQNDIGVRGIKLDGLTPEQAAKKVQEALAAANEDLAAFVLGASRTVTETLTTSIESWSETEQGRVFNGFVDQVTEVTRTIEATGTSYARTGETAVQTLERLAGSISTINPVLETLNLKLFDTSLAGADLASQLADAFGGLQAFGQATGTYYQEFFSEAERAANTTEQLTKALGGLGLALPTTREAFRDLVEAQDLNTEAGRKAFATLVGLSGTFAALVPAVEAVDDAATGATEALRSAADILREREGLERQLLQLQGDTTALRALDRAALDESNRALFDRITALQDSQAAEAAAAEATRTAAAEAAETARAAQAEAQRITQERLGLERQLLNLQGDQAAIRALERAALDSSNRALYDQITALQDSQAAAAAAAQAQRDYTAAVQTAQAAVQRARGAVASAQTGVDAVRAEATNAYLAAQDRVAEATKRIADLNNDLANRAREAALQMRELGDSLQSFVRGQTTSPQAQFAQTLREALGGDQAAMRNLPQAAEAAIEAARLSASTAAQAAIERARILSSVSEVAARAAATAVPDAPAAADPMAEAAQALATAQQSLAEALSVANQIGAPLSRTVEDLVSRYATAQQDLAQAVADLATAQEALAAIAANTGDTVAAVKNLDLTLTVTENTLDVQLRAVAKSDLPDYIKALIADAGKEYLITIDSVMAAGLSDAEKTLLLQSVTTASRSVILAAAFSDVLTADEKKALNAVNETVKKTIDAAVSSGTLTADQRTVLSQATETVAKTVTALVNSSNLSAEQRNFLALVTGSASTSSTVTVTGAVTFDPGNALQSIFNNISKSNALLAKVALAQLNPTTSTSAQKATVYAAFRELYTDAETRKIAETLYGPQTDASWNEVKKLAGFALGGVFTNGIVIEPTLFNMAQMGEQGPEAIMPLTRGADGSLGVRMFSDAQRRDEALVAEIRALRAEVVDLRAEARATAVSTNKTARILERVTPDGASLQTVAAP